MGAGVERFVVLKTERFLGKTVSQLKLIYRLNYLLITAIIKRMQIDMGFLSSSSGTFTSKLSLDKSIKYIKDVFQDYKDIAKIDHFYGKVAEVGPGDSNGVALLMIKDGANSVDLTDKYVTKRDPVYERMIKERLLSQGETSIERKITAHYGKEAAAEKFFKKNSGYDFIVSRAVLEHLDDPIISIKHMYDSLNKKGVMIHKVDLTDHGMFSSFGLHELTFLGIPDFIYKLITKNTGRPNRIMADEYVAFIKNNFNNYSIYVTKLVGKGRLEFSDYFGIDSLFEQVSNQAYNHSKSLLDAQSPESELDSIKKLVSGLFIVIRKD